MTPETVRDRYDRFAYMFRYLGPGVAPNQNPEPGVVYALETAENRLYSDPMSDPVLFASEAEAFAVRNALGSGNVLVFEDLPRDPFIDAADAETEISPEMQAVINGIESQWSDA